MKAQEAAPPIISSNRAPVALTILMCIFGLGTLFIMGVLSYFQLSSPSAALRQSVMNSVPGGWQTRVQVNLGWFTTHLVRAGSHFVKLPPEAHAALASVSAVEVGVYQLTDKSTPTDVGLLFSKADKAMARRGWERIVGVSQNDETVAIYMPRRGLREAHVQCCLFVFNQRELVVGSARGNVEPLLALARPRLQPMIARAHLALAN